MKKIVLLILVPTLIRAEQASPTQKPTAWINICQKFFEAKPIQFFLKACPLLICGILFYKLRRAQTTIAEQNGRIDELKKAQDGHRSTPQPPTQNTTPSPAPLSKSSSVSSLQSPRLAHIPSEFSSLSQDIPHHEHPIKPTSLDSIDTQKLRVIVKREFNIEIPDEELRLKKQRFNDLIQLISESSGSGKTAEQIANELLDIIDVQKEDDLFTRPSESAEIDQNKAPLRSLLRNIFYPS